MYVMYFVISLSWLLIVRRQTGLGVMSVEPQIIDQIAPSGTSTDPYAEQLEREQLRKSRLATVEKWKEVYALLFAFVAFAVSPSPLPLRRVY